MARDLEAAMINQMTIPVLAAALLVGGLLITQLVVGTFAFLATGDASVAAIDPSAPL
jgi:hypothetical protein